MTALVLSFGKEQVTLQSSLASDFQNFSEQAETKLGLHAGSALYHDRHGQLTCTEDLKRASAMANDGKLTIEVREVEHFARLRQLEEKSNEQKKQINSLEQKLEDVASDMKKQLELAKMELRDLVTGVNRRLDEEVNVHISELQKGHIEFQKHEAKVNDTLGAINAKRFNSIVEDFDGMKVCQRLPQRY